MLRRAASWSVTINLRFVLIRPRAYRHRDCGPAQQAPLCWAGDVYDRRCPGGCRRPKSDASKWSSQCVVDRAARVADRRRQGELEDGAAWDIWRRPQSAAVRVDNRTRDRQPHAHALRLGGEECLKEPVHPRRVEPGARILDRDEHTMGFVIGGYDLHPPPLLLSAAPHPPAPAPNPIQHDLLT